MGADYLAQSSRRGSSIMKLFSATLQLLNHLPMFIFFLMLLIPEAVHSVKCGLKKSAHRGQNRIINGQQADKNEWPWMASLRAHVQKGHYKCGVSVIGSRWLITAAHCLANKDGSVTYEDKDIKIYLGAHKTFPTQADNYETYSVEKFLVHEGWNTNGSYDNDIAVIKVSKKIDISQHTPVCLPGGNEDFTGSKAMATGWGTNSYHFFNYSALPQSPDVLQEVSLTIGGPSICTERPSGQGFLCADNSGAALCRGDSGGPLTVKDRKGRHTLVGVTSFIQMLKTVAGSKVCVGPGYFADVSFYRDWIKKKTGI